jgi:hypothetical protein
MKCEDCLFLIDDLIEAELDEHSAEQIDLHLFICPECAVQYELLQEERKIYTHYWLAAEPSQNLLTQFQAKLKTGRKELSRTFISTVRTGDWEAKISNFFRLSPPAALAGLIIIFGTGFVLLALAVNHENEVNKSTAKNELKTTEFPVYDDKLNKNDLVSSAAESLIVKKLSISKTNHENVPIPKKITVAVTTSGRKKNEVTGHFEWFKEQLERLKLKKFNTETAKQAEKIELLLRSFRNSQAAENGEIYDVTYEKQQARKLLEKNFWLRQNADYYGAVATVKVLSQAEPLLLEIANLESSPSLQKVLEIKERLRNQNLIVSLQVY